MRRVALLLLLLPLVVELSADWYRSDSLGRALSPLENPVPEEEEYLLSRTTSDGELHEELYSRARLLRRRIERELPGGEREEEVIEGNERRISLYRGGLPVREEVHTPGEAIRVYRYGWDERILTFSELSLAGELVYRQEYRTDPVGRLRRVLRIPASGDSAATLLYFGYGAAYAGSPEGLTESWVGGYDDGVRALFEGAEIAVEERMEGSLPVARIERSRRGEITVEESYSADDELLSRTVIGAGGELLREQIYRENELVRDREFLYQAGRLTETVVRAEGQLERRFFSYEQDNLSLEELFINRRLVRRVEYEGDERLESYYRRGEIVMQRRYRKDQLIEEAPGEEP